MADSTPDYYKAKLAPDTDHTKLDTWWRQDMSLFFYSPYKVRVLKRDTRLSEKRDRLSFEIVGSEILGTFEVDLKVSLPFVWPELPSTAQLAPEGSCGFLLLSLDWEVAETKRLKAKTPPVNVNFEDLREGGGKWPIAAPKSALKKHISKISDKAQREELLKAFDILKPILNSLRWE